MLVWEIDVCMLFWQCTLINMGEKIERERLVEKRNGNENKTIEVTAATKFTATATTNNKQQQLLFHTLTNIRMEHLR